MYLGIDLGTSSVKCVLLDEEQNVIAQSSESLTVSQPKPLWSEQNPDEWWQATCRAVNTLKNQHQKVFSNLKAIGLSGQQHGATLLDAQHRVLRPAMLWNDGRAFLECDILAERVPYYSNIIGSRLMPGFTAPKLEWVARNEPEIFKQIAKILLPKDYLRFKITGEFASDLSDASGTAWLNIASRTWSDEMLSASHLTNSHMPTLFEGSEITGKVSAKVAAEWDVSTNTVVVGGGGDNPAAAISMNVIQSGSAFLSIGTSGVYFVSSDTYQFNPRDGVHTFCHCLPKRWHHMSVHLSAASCLTWLANILNENDVAKLSREAEAQSRLDHTVMFLPYLSGERTPHNNPHAQGVLFGMTHTSSRADLTRAVMEGVGFAFADGQDAILQAGVEIKDVSVVGGGAQSYFWGHILASILNKPLIYRSNRDVGAALGAARLAWLAINPSDPEQAFVTQPIERIIEPDMNHVNYYQEKHWKFKKLYQSTKELFHSTNQSSNLIFS